MHLKFTPLSSELYEYLLARCTPFDEVCNDLVEETEREAGMASMMQIAQDQGAFMSMLVRISGARRALEVGTFTGYSALCIARALPADGTLVCIDMSEGWFEIARKYWQRAGVDHKIEEKLGLALDQLRALPADARFDIAFVDADKENYLAYYEEILARMDAGGLVLFDNVLWGASVIDAKKTDSETVGIRRLNDFVAADARVEVVMLAVGDGLSLVRKR